jgi:coenzyme F420 hydrogenase subunit beta
VTPTALESPQFAPAQHRNLCTDCGVSRMKNAHDCGQVCQFIKPDYPTHEVHFHGRTRQQTGSDELFFGVVEQIWRARKLEPSAGAQWTGITTLLAEQLLQSNQVDAVLTMRPDHQDRWRPVPVIVTEAADLASCRGMRMGYAPLLALLEPAAARGLKRLAVIGIPCQVHALRAMQKSGRLAQMGIAQITVIGTPCSDNTTTENFHQFLDLVAKQIGQTKDNITYLEFRADYHVELRFSNAPTLAIPYLQLPLSQLAPDFFPLTCRTCVDYTNSLADITVGYMGGSGQQWLLVRNQDGAALLEAVRAQLELVAPESAGKRTGAVKGFKKNVELAAGGLPLRRMPNWLRPIVGWLMPRIGPKGLEFARARVEMKAIETVLHLRREMPKKMRSMIPAHVWKLARPYGLLPKTDEAAKQPD